MNYSNIREEELKNRIAQDFFWLYDCTKIIGNVDFCVALHSAHKPITETESLLWAEAKRGVSDLYASITQLILTIGKERTFDTFLPPPFLGAFDTEKMAFVPYNEIQEIFYMNDFNWKVAPSNHQTKEFKLVYEKVQKIIGNKTLLFFFEKDGRELKKFIKQNFVIGKYGLTKVKIDKNNFITIYTKWLSSVKPTISVKWEDAKKIGLIDADFYLADLLSYENVSLKDKLFILLKKDHYEMDKGVDALGLRTVISVHFKDKQVAHTQFWNKYERPPKEEYWDYIVERRDLLVPQDIRERKGSFFTPQEWVELSQQYLAKTFGVDWQDEYYIWDCAAGTGNLLAGLTNKYHVWASTIDEQDVSVMHDRIVNGANLLHEHVFQLDFLNDDFKPKSKGGKIPDSLFQIISDEKKRKKLIIYINPPYAEATTAKNVRKTATNKPGVTTNFKLKKYFQPKIGNATNELYALFLANAYEKVPDCIMAFFSTVKFIQGTNFRKFKEFFQAKYLGGFIVPSNTFDNVKGKFPISFTIWNTAIKEAIQQINCDIYVKKKEKVGVKSFYGDLPDSINKWIKQFDYKNGNGIGYMGNPAPDFQHNSQLYLSIEKGIEHFNFFSFHSGNLIEGCVYFAVRHCIKPTWINDRDQFLCPNDALKEDLEFQNDCLAFTLFHSQNIVSSKEGTNHWIPFSEYEVDAKEKFESNFMYKFIHGKLKTNGNGSLYDTQTPRTTALEFSKEAQALFETGKALWKYYHQQPNANPNASLYDIKEYFQGRDDKGKMNNKSDDATFVELMVVLRDKLAALAEKLEPKVYAYGFLRV